MIIGCMSTPISPSTPITTGTTGTSGTLTALAGAIRLADWGLIRAQGADASTFLQSQLTQDVAQLPANQARLAGYCSAKGRLIASFVVWREGGAADAGAADGEAIYLACSADLLASTLKRLSMFVLRAKCKLSDASADLALFGLAGALCTAWLGPAAPAMPWGVAALGAQQALAAGRVIRLPDALGQPRYLLAQPPEAAPPALPALSAADWGWLEVHSGVARIVASTAEQFVPQMVNLELVGGVNFQKGCYPGQEVVARSQYRGTLKRRAMVFHSAGDLSDGQAVFHSADPGQPAGQVVLAAPQPGGGHSALVEIKLAALDSGSLHAGSAEGPLLIRDALPYDFPADQG